MIAVSSRHAVSVLALAAAAVVPIGWHALRAPVAESCRDAAALLASERIGTGRVFQRSGEPARHTTHLSGEVGPNPPGVFTMAFRVSRGSEPLAYYGSVEAFEFDNSYPLDAPGEMTSVDAGGATLPVRWLEDSFNLNFRVRAHFYVLDGGPVDSPFVAGVARAWRQLVGGTLPVTMFAFRAEGRATAADAMREQTRNWLREAWEHYQRVCSR